MAKHIHVHIHRAPTQDHAPIARAVRSISRDQHAAEDVSQLVSVLMQIIAEKEGTGTRDAEFDESKVKRDEGGRFSTQQHAAAAEEHTKAAAEHKKAGNKEAAKAHETAANHHGLAAQTGKALHAETAHNATKQALAVGSSSAPAGNASQGAKPMKATASGARAATHELLSSGHPFSVDELCKATGASKASVMTALSDLKNPKYAGKLGALEIVKRPDGMYHVQKKEGAGLAPKPGPDGQPMGKHPELEARAAASPDPMMMKALGTAASSYRGGTAISDDVVQKAGAYMAGKRNVDALKMSESLGIPVGHAMHLNEARKEHYRSSGGGAPSSAAQRADAYLSQKHLGLNWRGK